MHFDETICLNLVNSFDCRAFTVHLRPCPAAGHLNILSEIKWVVLRDTAS